MFLTCRWLTKPAVPVELQTLSLGSLQLLINADDNLISQGLYQYIFGSEMLLYPKYFLFFLIHLLFLVF